MTSGRVDGRIIPHEINKDLKEHIRNKRRVLPPLANQQIMGNVYTIATAHDLNQKQSNLHDDNELYVFPTCAKRERYVC